MRSPARIAFRLWPFCIRSGRLAGDTFLALWQRKARRNSPNSYSRSALNNTRNTLTNTFLAKYLHDLLVLVDMINVDNDVFHTTLNVNSY